MRTLGPAASGEIVFLFLFLRVVVAAAAALMEAEWAPSWEEGDAIVLLQTHAFGHYNRSKASANRVQNPGGGKSHGQAADSAALISARSAKDASNLYSSPKGRRLLDRYDHISLQDACSPCHAQRDVDRPWNHVNSTDVKYLFFSHHKVGTFLSFYIMNMMVEKLGLDQDCECISWSFVHVPGQYGCPHTKIAVYEDMTPEAIRLITQECPNMRAVHLTREAFSMCASNFVYDYTLHPGSQEILEEIAYGAYLRSLPWENAILDGCERAAGVYMQQMVASSVQITQDANPNILQLRYEDWMADYNASTRRIFIHFLGKKHEAIDDLVDAAVQFDLSLQTQKDLEANEHVSDDEEKRNVTQYLARFYWNSTSCAQALALDDELMGYPLPDAVADWTQFTIANRSEHGSGRS